MSYVIQNTQKINKCDVLCEYALHDTYSHKQIIVRSNNVRPKTLDSNLGAVSCRLQIALL